MALLELENLSLSIGNTSILENITLSLEQGEVMGLVGESGSGKSLTALSTIGLLPEGSSLTGSVRFDGKELLPLNSEEMCLLRGDEIAMVFQEPMTALNPVMTIGDQIAEGLMFHQQINTNEALDLGRTTNVLELDPY